MSAVFPGVCSVGCFLKFEIVLFEWPQWVRRISKCFIRTGLWRGFYALFLSQRQPNKVLRSFTWNGIMGSDDFIQIFCSTRKLTLNHTHDTGATRLWNPSSALPLIPQPTLLIPNAIRQIYSFYWLLMWQSSFSSWVGVFIYYICVGFSYFYNHKSPLWKGRGSF